MAPTIDYAKNLKNWTPGATTGARPVGRPRTRTGGSRSRSAGRTTGASGRILNAAAAGRQTQQGGLPAFAGDLANALGTLTRACAMAGFPQDVVQGIVVDGYSSHNR